MTKNLVPTREYLCFAGFKVTIKCATEISTSILKMFLMEQHNLYIC